MHRYSLPFATPSRTFTHAELYPSEDRAILRFYIRRDLLFRRNGTLEGRRVQMFGEVKLVGDRFKPRKPRRLYELAVERARFEVR